MSQPTFRTSSPRGRALARLAAGTLLASVGFVVALSGCGTSASDLCDLSVECEGGNDADYDACNARYDAVAEIADLKNCGEEYDSWIECFADNARCNDDRYRVDDDQCERAEEQLEDCAEVNL